MSFSIIDFILNLSKSGFWVFVLGGFICFFGVFYEWAEDQWLDNRIGGWFGQQERIFLRIFPPAVNQGSLGEMEQFFQRIWSIYQSRSKYEVYMHGRWYEGFSIEFHSKGGHIGIFMRLNKKHEALVRSSLEANFEGVGIAQYPDPFEAWPKEWDRKTGRYSQIYGTDMSILSARDAEPKKGSEADVYQLKTWKDFQKDTSDPTSDPAHALFNALKSIDPEEYLVIQFFIRPYFDGAKVEKWKKLFQDKRIEFTENTDAVLDEDGSVSMLTESEKGILNSMNKKIHSLNFRTKIRFVAFSNDQVKQKKAVAMAFSYFVQFDSSSLVFYPNSDAVTSAESKGDKFGVLGPQIGLWLDKVFYERERYFREKCIYSGLIGRSLDVGSVPFDLTPEELAAMIHFPYITEEESKIKIIAENTKIDNGNNPSRPFSTMKPPENLPT